MAAPTLVQSYPSAFNGTWSKTVSISTVAGEVLVAAAMAGEWGSASDDFADPTGGTGLSWTLRQKHQLALNSVLFVWTAPVVTTEGPFNLTFANGGGGSPGGVSITRWSGSGGIGATVKGNAGPGSAPSLAITAGGANSAIVSYFVDWSEQSPAGRAWRTINGFTPTPGGAGELLAIDITFAAVFYGAEYPDATGPQTTGMTAPNQKWVGAAIEVLGATATGAPQHAALGAAGATRTTAGATVVTAPRVAAPPATPTPAVLNILPGLPRIMGSALILARRVEPYLDPPGWRQSPITPWPTARTGQATITASRAIVAAPPDFPPTPALIQSFTHELQPPAGTATMARPTADPTPDTPPTPTILVARGTPPTTSPLAILTAPRTDPEGRPALILATSGFVAARAGQAITGRSVSAPPQPTLTPTTLASPTPTPIRIGTATIGVPRAEFVAFVPIMIGLDGSTTTTSFDGATTQPAGLDGSATSTGGIS